MLIMALINKTGKLFYLRDYSRGLSLLHKVINEYEENDISEKLIDIYDVYNMFYSEINMMDSARYYSNKQINLCKQTPDRRYNKALLSSPHIGNCIARKLLAMSVISYLR